MKSVYDSALDIAHQLKPDEAALYWRSLLASLPHGRLLDTPSGITRDAHTTVLIHATTQLEDIEKSGILRTAPGCLLSCVYTVPSRVRANPMSLHNYGEVVFRHLDPATELQRIAITVTKDVPLSVAGFSYLALGDYYDALITEDAKKEYPDNVQHAVDAVDAMLNSKVLGAIQRVREQYAQSQAVETYPEAHACITLVHELAKQVPILCFGYFEAVSQCLMLMSQDATTRKLSRMNEPHNFLYVHLLHEIAARQMDRFNAGLFNPSVDELLEILSDGTTQHIYKLDIEPFIIAVANQLIHLVGGQIARSDTALRGHSLYLFLNKKDPMLATFLQERTEDIIKTYWSEREIDLVYNATTIKGEVGITPCLDPKYYSVSVLTKKTGTSYIPARKIAIRIQGGVS